MIYWQEHFRSPHHNIMLVICHVDVIYEKIMMNNPHYSHIIIIWQLLNIILHHTKFMVEKNSFVNRTRNSIRLAGPASGIVTKTIDLRKTIPWIWMWLVSSRRVGGAIQWQGLRWWVPYWLYDMGRNLSVWYMYNYKCKI